MRGEIAARGVVPGAFYAIAAIGRNANAAGHADAGSAKIASCAEDFALRRFRRLRRENRVAGGESQHPGAFRAPARDRHHDADEIRESEFVAAEDARLQDAIKPAAMNRSLVSSGSSPAASHSIWRSRRRGRSESARWSSSSTVRLGSGGGMSSDCCRVGETSVAMVN